MLNRKTAPDFREIDHFRLPQAVSVQLFNNIPVHIIRSGSQPMIRLELIFEAGKWQEMQKGHSYFCTKMLAEGTPKLSSKVIQEKIAQYGAFLELESGSDLASVSLYSLSKHLPSLLPLLLEFITEASFPEDELETLKKISSQNLKVNLNKTSFLAGNKFRELLFGETHPYGSNLSEEDIKNINAGSLKLFHKHHFTLSNCTIIIAGNGDVDFEDILNKSFGKAPIGQHLQNQRDLSLPAANVPLTVIEKEDSVQSSIRVGRRLFPLNHPDYFKIYMLNEILGGYFGSRLMQNIREDKGYTYGIHSSVANHRHEGYFVIGTDVKKEFTENTLEEISKEMNLLKNEPVSENELHTVRNYILGSFINSLNTPFAIADKFKTIHFNQMTYDYYDRFFSSIKNIDSNDLLDTANKYFSEEGMVKVVAG